jgi:hypothetical protein
MSAPMVGVPIRYTRASPSALEYLGTVVLKERRELLRSFAQRQRKAQLGVVLVAASR